MRSSRYLHTLSVISLASLLAPGCHSEKDPFEDLVDFASTTGEDGDDKGKGKPDKSGSTKPDPKDKTTDNPQPDPGTGSTEEPGGTGGGGDTGGGGGGSKDCAPIPKRYVVLGDAIPLGKEGIDGPDDPRNAFKMMHEYIKETYKASDLSYENLSKGGAATKDVPGEQIDNVDTGKPGHVLVNIHIGGNDLAPFIAKSDSDAENVFDGTMEKAEADWQTVFDFFEDKSKFPDGATFIINTQYNPFDDCTETHNLVWKLTETKIRLMRQFNERIAALATNKANAVVADQYREFLGHGHHHDNDKCPHYKSGSEYWLLGGVDLTNINEAGYAAMGRVFEKVADNLYKDCPERN